MIQNIYEYCVLVNLVDYVVLTKLLTKPGVLLYGKSAVIYDHNRLRICNTPRPER